MDLWGETPCNCRPDLRQGCDGDYCDSLPTKNWDIWKWDIEYAMDNLLYSLSHAALTTDRLFA